MDLDYCAKWCSVEGEELRPKNRNLGNATRSGKFGRKTIIYLYSFKSIGYV